MELKYDFFTTEKNPTSKKYGDWIVLNSTKDLIATVYGIESPNQEETEKRAKLLALAPELYHRLAEIYKMHKLDEDRHMDISYEQMLIRIEKTLNKISL